MRVRTPDARSAGRQLLRAGAGIQERGAHHSEALLPFVSNAVIEGNPVTGQNSGSAEETATEVAAPP